MKRSDAILGFAAIGLTLAGIQKGFSLTNWQTKPLHIIGLGNAGCNALELIHKKGTQARYTCIGSQLRPELPKDISFIEYTSSGKIWFTETEEIALSDDILELFQTNDRFCLLAGLGKSTGTSLAQGLTERLHQQNKNFYTICSLPISWEGRLRGSLAERTVEKLRSIPNCTFFSLDQVWKGTGNVRFSQFYATADEQFYKILNQTIQLDFKAV